MTTHHAKKKPTSRRAGHMPIADTVKKAIVQADVPFAQAATPVVVDKIEGTLAGELLSGKKAIVNVKPDWQSKIQWTQVVGVVAMIATMFGFEIDAKTQATIVAVLLAAMAGVTMVWRKWFTPSVTSSSLPSPPDIVADRLGEALISSTIRGEPNR